VTEAKRKVEPRAVRLANRVQKAVDDGTDTVEEIHKKVASVPLTLLEQIERFKAAAKDLHKLQDRSIGVVYKVVRDINHDVIRLVKKILAPPAKRSARARPQTKASKVPAHEAA
jgi:hypothetical protein